MSSDKEKPDLKINMLVDWISQDVSQWDEPRRLVYISFDFGQWWCFVDGSMTGFPAGEIKENKI